MILKQHCRRANLPFDLQVWVDLSNAYSKRSDLAEALVRAVSQLQGAQQGAHIRCASVRSIGRSERDWRVSDRLSEAEIRQLVADFQGGTAKRKLAERYGISESSAKRITRKYRVEQFVLAPCRPQDRLNDTPDGGSP